MRLCASAAIILAFIPANAAAQAASPIPLSLPVRPADAPTGSQFCDKIAALPLDRREAAILKQITSGNVPALLRRLAAIQVEAADSAGTKHTATYFVTCDYLA